MSDRIASFLFEYAIFLMPPVIAGCVVALALLVRRWPARAWRRVIAATLSLFLLAIGLIAGALLYAERNIRSIVEHRVRVLTLRPVIGTQPAKIADLRGKVVLVNFWATWCAPCRAELPDMNRLALDFARRDVSILTITDEPREQIERFEKEILPLHTLSATFDSDQPRGTLAAAAYQGRPTTVVLDAEGQVRDTFIGKQSYAVLRQAIERQLR